jgi:hypothetical protein
VNGRAANSEIVAPAGCGRRLTVHTTTIPEEVPMRTVSLLLPAAACGALTAQSTMAVPANAGLADGHHATALPFGVPGFRSQILVDAAAIAPNGAVLTGIRFRADRTSLPLRPVQVPNVAVAMSQSALLPGQLTTSFQGNVTGAPAPVFQGTASLPAHSTANAGPLPFDVSVAFATPFQFTAAQGSLLVDITGNNAPGGAPVFWLDAAQQGGAATQFGEAGTNPSSDFLNLIASTANSLEPRRLAPGSFVDYTSTLSFTNPPGLLLLGAQAFPAPIDLGPVGAPTHSVYVDPLAYVPHAWQPSFLGWFSTFRLAVPNRPVFVDQLVFAQSLLFDPSANAAGILTSRALETRIGDNAAPFPMQQLDANDPAAAIGTLLDFGFAAPEFGAAVVLLEGVFF